MSAALARILAVRRAAAGFLAGFLGVGPAPCGRVDGKCLHAGHESSPSPSSVRAALAARSARRGNCC